MLQRQYQELVKKELPDLDIEERQLSIPELLKEVAIELFLKRSNNKLLIEATTDELNLLRLTGRHNLTMNMEIRR